KMMYLIADRRVFTPWGTLICFMPSFLASLLSSSWREPKGQSQPQKAPRFQKTREIAVAHQSKNTTGSIRKYSQRKSVRKALKNVSTFTTESWAWLYQPSQTRENVRKASRKRS